MTAIEFLRKEGKHISIDVLDYIDDNDIYPYRGTKTTYQWFETTLDLDFDEFYFEADISVSFDCVAWHHPGGLYEPEEHEIDFQDIDAEVRITTCMKWDDESEEMKDYNLSIEERLQVEDYLENNIWLN